MDPADIDPEHLRRLERMYRAAPNNAYYLPELAVRPGRARVCFAVRPDFYHAAGAVHGSVYFKALDDAAYFAASSLVTDVFLLTAAFELQLRRPVRGGRLTALGKVLQASDQEILAEARLYDHQEHEVARGEGRFVRGQTPLTPEIGYR